MKTREAEEYHYTNFSENESNVTNQDTTDDIMEQGAPREHKKSASEVLKGKLFKVKPTYLYRAHWFLPRKKNKLNI